MLEPGKIIRLKNMMEFVLVVRKLGEFKFALFDNFRDRISAVW
jgi:hypothetical protein